MYWVVTDHKGWELCSARTPKHQLGCDTDLFVWKLLCRRVQHTLNVVLAFRRLFTSMYWDDLRCVCKVCKYECMWLWLCVQVCVYACMWLFVQVNVIVDVSVCMSEHECMCNFVSECNWVLRVLLGCTWHRVVSAYLHACVKRERVCSYKSRWLRL